MFYILDVSETCKTLLPILVIVRSIVSIIQWVVPVILIVLGTVDLVKAVTQGKEDDIKKGQKTLITRAIAAVIVFLVPLLVNVIMNFIGSSEDNYAACWKQAGSGSIGDAIDGTLSTDSTD